MAGEMQLDRPARRAAVGVRERRAQIGVREHAAAVVAQTDAGIREPRHRHRRLHVDRGIVRLGRGVSLGLHRVRGVIRRGVRFVTRVLRRRHGLVVTGMLARRRARVSMARVLGCGRFVTAVAGVPHVRHRQIDRRIERGHRGFEAFAHCERRARVAAAIERLREQRERVRAARLDEHVEHLGRAETKLLDLDRPDVLAVGRDDRHRKARDPHVERRHRRAVDDPEAHALAGCEEPRPVAGWRLAVHEIRVRVAADVGEIGRRHPHPRPREAILQRVAEAVALAVAHEVAERALVVVEVVRVALEKSIEVKRIAIGPVGEQDTTCSRS